MQVNLRNILQFFVKRGPKVLLSIKLRLIPLAVCQNWHIAMWWSLQ